MKLLWVVAIAAAVSVSGGCSRNSSVAVDSTPGDDGPHPTPDLGADLAPDLAPLAPDLSPDLAPDLAPDLSPDVAPDIYVPPGSLDCSGGDCKDFVLSELLVPADAAQAAQFGVDFDNNGTVDNQLGNILSALGSFVADFALQPALTEAMNRGETILLMRVQGGDFANAPQAAAQMWGGQSTNCCSAQSAPPQCAIEAAQGCFGGGHQFQIDPAIPTAVFGGAITGGQSNLLAPQLELTIPMASGALTLPLQQAQIIGTFSGDKIINGKIVGGVDMSDLNNSLIPAIHQLLLASIAQDPNGLTAQQILQIFDGDGDGVISLSEVQTNDVIMAFLQGDVDVDGDGDDDLSIGLGFTAVSAKILP